MVIHVCMESRSPGVLINEKDTDLGHRRWVHSEPRMVHVTAPVPLPCMSHT